jgi:DNA excision repair protein ERCC-3
MQSGDKAILHLSSSTKQSDIFEKIDTMLSELDDQVKRRRDDVARIIKEQSFQSYDMQKIDNFLSKPYVTIPKSENQWYVIVPRFIDLQVGWLLRQTDTYNVFLVDIYSKWLYGVPKALEDAVDFVEPPPITLEGDFLKVDPGLQDKVFKKYKRFLHRRDGLGTIKIKPKARFNLVSELVKDGVLPFSPKPIAMEDIIERPIQIELRNYQQEAVEKFRKYGSIGVFWMPSAGKTIIGLYLMNMLKGKKLIVVPTLTLVEQWKQRITQYTTIPIHECDIITYSSAHKVIDKEYTFTIFDECHHLPANVFSKLALIKTKYRLGLSATPYREDGRNELIFALTGFPLGLDWRRLMEINKIQKPKVRVIITANDSGKITVLDGLLKDNTQKTMIFCDRIAAGKRLAARYQLKFLHGQSKNRLSVAMKERTFIMSRVGDEGLSLDNLERVIEFSFLFGSRRQELQRLGRLFHSSFGGEHVILMSREEFSLYRKRLFSIYEKGIEILLEEK